MTINKNIMKIAAIGFVGILGLSGCNDSFMDKYSETSITEEGFSSRLVIWKSIQIICTDMLLPIIGMLHPIM